MAYVQKNALDEVDLIKGLFGSLVKKPVKSDAQVKDLLAQAFPNVGDNSAFMPPELRDDKTAKVDDYNVGMEAIRVGIFDVFSSPVGIAITPDFYGIANAGSQYFCHIQASKRPIAESVMFGPRQKNMTKLLKVLAE